MRTALRACRASRSQIYRAAFQAVRAMLLHIISNSMKHTVAHINMYDEPDSERAKIKIGKWFSTTEKGQWCRDRFVGLSYRIEPDGGMEPHYWIELDLEFTDKDSTLYALRWGTEHKYDIEHV